MVNLNMVNLKCTLFLILSAFIFGCEQHTPTISTRSDKVVNSISSGSTYWLSAEEIQVLEKKANSGDKNAAFRLYQYHMFVSLNQELEYKWLTVAAQNEHPIAQSNLAELFLQDNDKEKAAFWAKKAHANSAKLPNDLLNLIK